MRWERCCWSSITSKMEFNGIATTQVDPGPGFICGAVEGFYGRPWTTEQRKDLFERFKQNGLNTYLYAPKDDLKHRFEWRARYNSDEEVLLRSLIEHAHANNVTFVYSLSPGIDIVYSDPDEVAAIEQKLRQVQDLGCNAFALLFDDIESTMNQRDSERFDSFVSAQLAVTNEVYDHMNRTLFFFCPTEYCSSRCVPNLLESDYLNTLGQRLHDDIHILWTGPQVVSPEITVEHAREVASVMRRKPLIWDNLHANDYDPKRVFLGPFKNRSVALKAEVSGILLNPNCKYEANFIPFYTLAVWNSSDRDESDMDSDENDMEGLGTYRPNRALVAALGKWCELYMGGPGPAVPPISQVECTITPVPEPSTGAPSIILPPPTIRTCEGNDLIPDANEAAPPVYTSPTGNATTVTVQAFPINEAIMGVEDAHDLPLTVNSLCTEYSEAPPLSKPQVEETSSCQGLPMEDDSTQSPSEPNKINVTQLALLVDLFYLPFDYGQKGTQLLEDFQWMHKTAIQLKQSADPELAVEFEKRFTSVRTFQKELELLFRVFLDAPNRSLVQEIFPYVSEAHAITSVLTALSEWLRAGGLVVAPANVQSWWRDRRPDVEPWSFGQGILADLQKLMISSSAVADLLVYRAPIPLPISSYQLRVADYRELNMQQVYEFFSRAAERDLLRRISAKACTDLFFDRTFAFHFKYGLPPHHFLVEEINSRGETSLFGLLTTIISMPAVRLKVREQYAAEYREKYVDMLDTEDMKQATKLFAEDFEAWPIFHLPDEFLTEYPSFIEVRWRDFMPEAAWVRRLIHCATAALAMNGSTGLFTILPSEATHLIQLFGRFGLQRIESLNLPNHVVMAHSLV